MSENTNNNNDKLTEAQKSSLLEFIEEAMDYATCTLNGSMIRYNGKKFYEIGSKVNPSITVEKFMEHVTVQDAKHIRSMISRSRNQAFEPYEVTSTMMSAVAIVWAREVINNMKDYDIAAIECAAEVVGPYWGGGEHAYDYPYDAKLHDLAMQWVTRTR